MASIHSDPVSRIVDSAAETLDTASEGRRLLLPITAHEDRVSVYQGLSERLGASAVGIDLLDADEVDAPICGVLEAASRFDDPEARLALARDWGSLAEAVGVLGGLLQDYRRTLLVHVPSSWWAGYAPEAYAPEVSAERVRLGERRLELLRRLATLPAVIAWITGRNAPPAELGWDPAQDRILHLGGSDDKTPRWCPPAAWLARLLYAQGEPPDPDLPMKPRAAQINALTRRLQTSLAQGGREPYGRALQQWARVRRPLRAQDLLKLVEWPDEWRNAIEADVPDNEYVQLEPRVLQHLTSALPSPPRVETDGFHARAAEHYEGLDGQRAFSDTCGREGVWWLEKVHHLAHGGQATLSKWEEQELLCREQYWSRARHLSMIDRDHAAAARLYRRCVDHFEDDDYGWHYLGFNLQRARGPSADVEAAYRAAVDRNETNPWWNGRLVSFLIGEGRHRAAREAWTRASERLDGSVQWVAENAHRWVSRTWLMLDVIDDARAVLDEISDDVIDRSEVLDALRHDVLDAEEYRRLGEHAVYPIEIPHHERWRAPRTAPAEEYERWFPGQILDNTEGGATIVYAVPTDPPAERRAVIARFTAEQWRQLTADDRVYAAGDFIELLRLRDGRHTAHFVGRDPTQPTGDEARVHRMLNPRRDVG